jgi:hypothetical protein
VIEIIISFQLISAIKVTTGNIANEQLALFTIHYFNVTIYEFELAFIPIE